MVYRGHSICLKGERRRPLTRPYTRVGNSAASRSQYDQGSRLPACLARLAGIQLQDAIPAGLAPRPAELPCPEGIDARSRRGLLHRTARHSSLRRVELVEPKDVAWFLASYAREAKARVEDCKDLPELAAIRSALEEALGMEFEGEKGEHFFRSTLVQTLCYGIFSAWVLWDKHHKGDPAARFNWHEAGWYLHVPMISALFQQISSRAQLGPLDVAEVLDWAGGTLTR